MWRNKSFAKDGGAVTRALCETLEARWLLATYLVPPGHTAAYLTNGPLPGSVLVHLDSPTAPPEDPNPFFATTGQHVLDAGTNGTAQNPFLVVDRVWARWKPHATGGNPEGVKVIASDGGNATLRIESNNVQDEFWDRQYIVHPSTSEDTRIEALNWDTLETGETHIGPGVSNVIIRTNDVQASEHFSTNPPLPTNPGTRVHVRELAAGIHLTVDTGAGTWDKVIVGGGIDNLTTGLVAEEVRVITGAGHAIVAARGTQNGITRLPGSNY